MRYPVLPSQELKQEYHWTVKADCYYDFTGDHAGHGEYKNMAHWRDSARSVRLWLVDFRACFPLLLLIFHIRLWTFLVTLVAIAFFGALERYGFSLIVFLRWFRSFLAGPRKIAQPWWRK